MSDTVDRNERKFKKGNIEKRDFSAMLAAVALLMSVTVAFFLGDGGKPDYLLTALVFNISLAVVFGGLAIFLTIKGEAGWEIIKEKIGWKEGQEMRDFSYNFLAAVFVVFFLAEMVYQATQNQGFGNFFQTADIFINSVIAGLLSVCAVMIISLLFPRRDQL